MIALCTCKLLSKWAKDPKFPILERNGEYFLGDDSGDDPRLKVAFCPFCGEHGWPDRGDRTCECGVMKSIVRDFPNLMEFDSRMDEFHILHSSGSGKLQVYYCISCGGNPPESLRSTNFEDPTDSDFDEAWARVQNLNDEGDYIHEFGEPTHVFNTPPTSENKGEIYGVKRIKKQWTFEPANSPISYYLQLMCDGTYQKSLSPKHKKNPEA